MVLMKIVAVMSEGEIRRELPLQVLEAVPSINILIKLMCVIALVLAPLF